MNSAVFPANAGIQLSFSGPGLRRGDCGQESPAQKITGIPRRTRDRSTKVVQCFPLSAITRASVPGKLCFQVSDSGTAEEHAIAFAPRYNADSHTTRPRCRDLFQHRVPCWT